VTAARLEERDTEALLDGCARGLLDRHVERSKEWFPHELVPWEQACGCREGSATAPEETAPDEPVPDGVASALFVNLLTEDNLPHYFHAISGVFAGNDALAEWSRRWTAEEQRHAIVIRDWICVTRRLDLVELERARMQQVCAGFDQELRDRSLVDGIVYLTLQELATRISHWNTGRWLDPVGAAVMKRVAADENRHFLFYRDLATEALRADPSSTVAAIDRQVSTFKMPGTLIDGFHRHAQAIAAAGIYDLRTHLEQVLAPLVTGHWRIEDVEDLDDEAERARDHLMAHVARVGRVVGRMESARPA
jgi:acyl-[acyl-carrier-protein] desaturase